MKIETLSLVNYRNIETMTLNCHPGINVLVGDNGQGKTNIVEALVYLSFGQSFRVNDDKVLIRNDEAFAKIDSRGTGGDELSVVISKAGKYITRNGAVLPRLSDLIGIMNVVLFQPEDLNFFSNAPRLRRREIDYELGKAHHETLIQLSRHRQLLNLRNSALKAEPVDLDYIDVIDEELISISVQMIQWRHAFIEDLNERIKVYYPRLSHSEVQTGLHYQTMVDPLSVDLKAAVTERMEASRSRDLLFKMTHVGIHRDDYIFTMEEGEVAHRASQGQRRMLMLAYKFSLIDYFKDLTGHTPILCLDDLYSELDQEKRNELLNWIPKDVQIFITTTDLAFIDPYIKGKIFNIDEGKLIREALR